MDQRTSRRALKEPYPVWFGLIFKASLILLNIVVHFSFYFHPALVPNLQVYSLVRRR